jgi:hypothetical protein
MTCLLGIPRLVMCVVVVRESGDGSRTQPHVLIVLLQKGLSWAVPIKGNS